MGSLGSPMLRANTLVEPPGSTASAVADSGDAGRHLVDGAVAAERRDDVDPAAGGVLREAGGVAATAGLDDLDVVLLRQHLVHHHGVAGGDRRRERVDDEQETHEAINVTGPARCERPGRRSPVWPRR